MLNGCDISILLAEVENRKKRISEMKEKYAQLKTDLTNQLTTVKVKYEMDKSKLQNTFQKQKKEMIKRHEQEVNQLKSQNDSLIKKIQDSIKPDRFVEAQIKLAKQDMAKTLAEKEEKINLIEEEAFNQIQPINKEVSELQAKVINLEAEIEAVKNTSKSSPPPKINQKESRKKYQKISTTEQENQMQYDFSVQKLEKRHSNVRELLEYENNKVRKEIKQKQETVDLQIQLIAQLRSEHKEKMLKYKKEISALTREACISPQMSASRSKPIPHINEKIDFFELHKRELKMKLAQEREKLKKFRERNRQLSFELRRRQFQRGELN